MASGRHIDGAIARARELSADTIGSVILDSAEPIMKALHRELEAVDGVMSIEHILSESDKQMDILKGASASELPVWTIAQNNVLHRHPPTALRIRELARIALPFLSRKQPTLAAEIFARHWLAATAGK